MMEKLALSKDGRLLPKKKFKSIDEAISYNMGKKTHKSLKEALKEVEESLRKMK